MKKILVLLFILSISITFANNKPTEKDKKIIELALNYEFNKANEILKPLMLNSNKLKYHFLYLNVEVIKSEKIVREVPFDEVKNVRDSIHQVLIKYSENVIETFEDKNLDINERFYLGSIYGFLGRFYGVTKSYYDAFSYGKEGKNILEEVLKESPKLYDANLLLGMLNYYTDRLGGVTEFVLGILGLSGDRETGIKQLYLVEEKGFLNNWLSTMVTAEIHTKYELNSFDALPLFEKFVKRFPQNTLFKNWLCSEYLKLYQPLKVKKFIENDTKNEIHDYIKALYYHCIGDYETSNNFYNNFLPKENKSWSRFFEHAKFIYKVNSFLLGKGKSNYKLNHKYQKQYYNLIKDPVTAKDLYSFKKAVLLNNEINVQNYFDKKNIFDKGNYYVSNFNFLTGVYFYKQNKFKKSENYFIKSKKLNFEDFGEPASIYLIDVYKKIDAQKNKVKKLLDDIDEIDNAGLEISAEDLEKKYDL